MLNALKNGNDLKKIKGISYKQGNKFIHNPDADLIDLDSISCPTLSLIHPQKKKILSELYIAIWYIFQRQEDVPMIVNFVLSYQCSEENIA